MARYSDIIRDDQTLAPVAGVLVSVINRATGMAATLTADGGGPLANPLTSDTFGAFYFNAADAVYRLEMVYGGRTVEKDEVIVGEPPEFEGPPGPANVLTPGTVTKIAAGGTPTISITGTSPAQVLSVGLVTGDTGTTGSTGSPGYIVNATYTGISAITSTAGFGGVVVGPDTGTHTDPVTSATVPNVGEFSYSTSPAGWTYVGPLRNLGGDAAYASLAGYAALDVTFGDTPSAAGITAQAFIQAYASLAPAPSGGYLKQIVVPVFSTGTGFLTIYVTLPAVGAAIKEIYRRVTLAAFTGTGLKTLTAGTHFSGDIWVPTGATVWIGGSSGQAEVGKVTGASSTITATDTGSAIAVTSSANKCPFSVTLTSQTTVAASLASIPNSVSMLNDAAADLILCPTVPYGYFGSSSTYADQGYVHLSNGVPIPCGGQYVGAYYKGVATGALEFEVWRPLGGGAYKYINGFSATIATGDQYAANTAPFRVEAGDIEVPNSSGGRLASATPPNFADGIRGLNFSNVGDRASSTPVVVQTAFAMSGVVSRFRTSREEAAIQNYGSTPISNTGFPGASLPAGYAVGGGPGVSFSDGAVFTSGSLNYNSYVIYGQSSHAERKTISGMFVMTDATAKVGAMTFPQDGSVLAYGTLALYDASAGASSAILSLQASGFSGTGAPSTTPITVVVPWTVVAGRSYPFSLTKNRGYIEFTVSNPYATPQSVTVSGTYGQPGGLNGGLMWGKPGVIGLSGNSKVTALRSETGCSPTPDFLFFGTSIDEGDPQNGQMFDYTGTNQVIERIGRNRAFNMARLGATATTAAACLTSDLAPFTPRRAAVWLLGANETSQATWRTQTLVFVDACIARNIPMIMATMVPQDAKLSLMASLNADIRGQYFATLRGIPPIPYVNLDVSVSASNAPDAGWNVALSHDLIHPMIPQGSTPIRQQWQRDLPWVFPFDRRS